MFHAKNYLIFKRIHDFICIYMEKMAVSCRRRDYERVSEQGVAVTSAYVCAYQAAVAAHGNISRRPMPGSGMQACHGHGMQLVEASCEYTVF